MVSAERLAIWLGGAHVATVERERRGRLHLSYTEAALASYPGGSPLLSLDLPLTNDRYSNARTRAFLDGLLPEGEPRRAIAADLDLPASDVFGLLAALGKDCAGALVIAPYDELPPVPPTTLAAEPVDADELAALVANLRSAPLGVDRNVRLSLAGAQEKLLLTRMTDGSWGRPVDGAASTHILKPEIARFGNTVENERFCMEIARRLGLDVATTETILLDGMPVLVVERYDRVIGADGAIDRIHQEDLCQALGLPPELKYEDGGGPSLARIARLLQEVAAPGSAARFLEALTLNVAIGNCDAHAKNFSLLHGESGALRLAPLYDLVSTRLYPLSDQLAMHVDSIRRADRVTAARIVEEASHWGMGQRAAAEIVSGVLERLPEAVVAAERSVGAPNGLAELVAGRIEKLQATPGAVS